jgi:hypothetical protein
MSRDLTSVLLALFLGPLGSSWSARFSAGIYFRDSTDLSLEFVGTIHRMGFPVWYLEYAVTDWGSTSEAIVDPARWLMNEAIWFTGTLLLVRLLLGWRGHGRTPHELRYGCSRGAG